MLLLRVMRHGFRALGHLAGGMGDLVESLLQAVLLAPGFRDFIGTRGFQNPGQPLASATSRLTRVIGLLLDKKEDGNGEQGRDKGHAEGDRPGQQEGQGQAHQDQPHKKANNAPEPRFLNQKTAGKGKDHH